ncbi:response regulator [Aquabacterium sp.]|uniref:response regulator n=1 Tax=Aquabacterium sp. TaxID=1872578 RepID=UPI0037833CE2
MSSASAPYRFMVVDDSRAIQAIISRVIEDCGYPAIDVRRACDGEEALSLLPGFTPQLLITDWHMPRVSGLELLQTLRQLGQTQVKVGFVTTESTPAMLEQARTNGAVFIVNKPFRDGELIEQIRSAVPCADAAPRQAPAAQADAAPAPADEPEAPAPEDYPLSLAHAHGLIEHTLGKQPFTLERHAAMAVERLGPNNLLGLYSAPGKPAAAVAVFDVHAVCLVGGAAARLPTGDLTAAQLAAEPTEVMVQQATTFMRAAGMMLQAGGSPDGCTLTRTMQVAASFPKLEEVLARTSERVDYQLTLPGLGEGRLSFIAL